MLSAMTPVITIRCRAAGPQRGISKTDCNPHPRRTAPNRAGEAARRPVPSGIGRDWRRSHTGNTHHRPKRPHGSSGLEVAGPMNRRMSPEFATSCAATQRDARRQPRRKHTRLGPPNPLFHATTDIARITSLSPRASGRRGSLLLGDRSRMSEAFAFAPVSAASRSSACMRTAGVWRAWR